MMLTGCDPHAAAAWLLQDAVVGNRLASQHIGDSPRGLMLGRVCPQIKLGRR